MSDRCYVPRDFYRGDGAPLPLGIRRPSCPVFTRREWISSSCIGTFENELPSNGQPIIMSSSSPLSAGQAIGRWFVHMFVFILAGGTAAGSSALVYEAIAQTQNPIGIYGIIFAAGGIIAYRLTEQVLNE